MIRHTSIALLAMLTALGCASAGSSGKPSLHAATPALKTAAASERTEEPTLASPPPAHAFAFAHVIHDGGLRILLDGSPDDAWAAGAPKLLSKGSPVVARREIDATKLPASLASSVGRRVQLMRAGERVCEATITGLSLIGRVEPYFGARADWDGAGEPSRKPLSADEIADEAWKLSDTGGHALAAELGALKGDGCDTATWARDLAAPLPRVAAAKPARTAVHQRAVDALRKLDGYADIQGAYEAADPAHRLPAWDKDEDTDIVVSEMSFGRGDRTLVWISARSRETCGSFYGELSALFELREGPLGPELAVRYEERAAPGSEPEAAIDAADGDLVDVLFTGARLHEVSSRYQLDAAIVPFLDCPC